MSSILLQVEGLTIVSDEGVIIDHLSFAVDKSEIIALTGKSGSGKTTIGLAILGMLPDGLHWKEGSIIWHGERSDSIQIPRDSVKWSTLRGREIAYIQQDVFGIFDPVLRIGKQMTMIVRELSGKPTKDIDTALRSTMKEVGISEIDRVWNSFPHQLSGGQLQRCQICLAIVMQPELIIADEPTSAIDKIHQVEILDLLIHMRNQYQIAILCITHEESVVNYLADRIIPLNTTEEKNTERKDQNILRDGMPEMPVLNVEHLGFTHQYGGLFSKEGAKIKDINFRLHAGHCMG
ncbi:MAG: ATP-binding cassette domain-containing protein, partial [Saprospiraceae bacterium]